MSFCQSKAFNLEKAQQKAGGRNKMQEQNFKEMLGPYQLLP